MELDLSLSTTVRALLSFPPPSRQCSNKPRFSVGSGRPPVISSQYFDECAKVIEFPFYNARDELVLAGVNLYRTLWELTSSNVIRQERTVWPEIDDLRKSQEHIYSKNWGPRSSQFSSRDLTVLRS